MGFFVNEEDAKAYTGVESTPYCMLNSDSLANPTSKFRLKTEKYGTTTEGEHKKITLNSGTTGDAIDITGKELGIKTMLIPENCVLKYLIINSCSTWENTNNDSDACAEAYIWKGDYDSTYAGKPVASAELYAHSDNADCYFNFGNSLRYGYEYLIVITATNAGRIGYWPSGKIPEDSGWEVYLDGEYDDVSVPSITYVLEEVGELPDFTAVPTDEATATPEITETPETPEATEEAEVTADVNTPEAQAEDKSGCGSIITGCTSLVLFAGAVAVLLRKKH